VDTLAKVRPGLRLDRDAVYAVDEDLAFKLKTIADSRRLAIVLCHHTRKTPTEDPWDAILGSATFQGVFDSLMLFRRPAGSHV
jgi:hypothetical protein